jgi:transcriptional regulator with XRE-family HTH domain
MNRIGERVKQKRENLGLQLNDLAKRVGISSSALSQIENAKSHPTIITLKLIAVHLKTTVGDLIGENESLINNPVFRSEDLTLTDTNETGTEVYTLSQNDVSKQMDAFLLKFNVESDSRNLFRNYNGQMFGYLLNGEIQFEIDSKVYVIRKGDSIYFNLKRNYRFQNINKECSELLCVSVSNSNN